MATFDIQREFHRLHEKLDNMQETIQERHEELEDKVEKASERVTVIETKLKTVWMFFGMLIPISVQYIWQQIFGGRS